MKLNETEEEAYSPPAQRSFFVTLLPLFVLAHFAHHLITALPVPLLPVILNGFHPCFTVASAVMIGVTLIFSVFLLKDRKVFSNSEWYWKIRVPRRLGVRGKTPQSTTNRRRIWITIRIDPETDMIDMNAFMKSKKKLSRMAKEIYENTNIDIILDRAEAGAGS